STSSKGSILKAFKMALEEYSKKWTSGPKIFRKTIDGVASHKADFMGAAMVKFFGKSSAKSIEAMVETASAKTVPTATETAVGTPTPPRRTPRPWPTRGSAT